MDAAVAAGAGERLPLPVCARVMKQARARIECSLRATGDSSNKPQEECSHAGSGPVSRFNDSFQTTIRESSDAKEPYEGSFLPCSGFESLSLFQPCRLNETSTLEK